MYLPVNEPIDAQQWERGSMLPVRVPVSLYLIVKTKMTAYFAYLHCTTSGKKLRLHSLAFLEEHRLRLGSSCNAESHAHFHHATVP
jgi:hypothetical protein